MKKRKLFLLIIPAALLLWVLLWFIHPLCAMKLFYWTCDEDGLFSIDDYRSMYEDYPEDYQLIRDELVFPDSDISDYCTVVVGMQARNISPLHAGQIEMTVDWNDPDSDVVLVMPSVVSEISCRRFSRLEARYLTSFLVYRNGKSNEEIADYLQNAEVIVSYQTALSSHSKRMKLGDLPHKIMDDWNAVPKGWKIYEEVQEDGVTYTK